jgi:hypothetical protein
MSTILGSARRARALNDLFAAWKRACDMQDHATMTVARRAIDTMMAGRTPSEAVLKSRRQDSADAASR